MFIQPFVMPGVPPDAVRARYITRAYNLTGLSDMTDGPVLEIAGQVRNRARVKGTPSCVLFYGSQIAFVKQPYAVGLPPGEVMWIAGKAHFLLPLDDSESGGFECFHRIPHRIALEMSRSSIELVGLHPRELQH